MYKNKTLSVIIPAYNEEKAISSVIKGFQNLGIADKIIIVDNNSEDMTAEIAKKLGAKVVKEKRQGYGHACIRGLKESNTDLTVLVEGDSTFDPKDTIRMLKLSSQYDMVMGSRTTKSWYGEKANMNWYIRLGNYLLSTLLRILYRPGVPLNDVGCTYRVIRKKTLENFVTNLEIGGCDFTPEMTVEALKADASIKQIPIYYNQRKGDTKLSDNWLHSLKIGVLHFILILRKRFCS